MLNESEKINEIELGISDVIMTGWSVYCKQIKDIAILMFIGSVPGTACNYMLAGDINNLNNVSFYLQMIGVAVMVIMYMGVMVIVENTMKNNDDEMDWSIAIYKAYSKFNGRIVVGLLAGIVTVFYNLTLMPENVKMELFCLLLVAVIIWSINYVFFLQVVILRGLNGEAAFDYSKSLVKGRWWKVFSIMLIIGLIMFLLHVALLVLSILFVIPKVIYYIISIGIDILRLGFPIVITTVLFLNLEKVDNVKVDLLNEKDDENKNGFAI